jgi:hypothetical protein
MVAGWPRAGRIVLDAAPGGIYIATIVIFPIRTLCAGALRARRSACVRAEHQDEHPDGKDRGHHEQAVAEEGIQRDGLSYNEGRGDLPLMGGAA